MKQVVNDVYQPLFTQRPRYFFLMGGRGAGRSTVASQLANTKLAAPEYFRCAIMRYVLGDIRNSIYREITDRAQENGILDKLDINETLMTIKYGANSINAVGFKKSSSDQKAKLKSLANYNTIIIEEADEIAEEDFMQLDDSLRTLKGNITIIFLFNPPAKSHWIIKRWFDLHDSGIPGFYVPALKPDVENAIFIRTSFRDNIKNIDPQSISNYLNYKKTNPDHYYNMIEGLVPEVVKGRIYPQWNIIDEVPFEAKLVRYWNDFGYSNDPNAMGAVYEYNGGYILDEIAYDKEMSNRLIADVFIAKPKALVIADSSEPKSIAEISGYGVTIIGAEKGADSINNGIQIVKDSKISVTRRSKNIIEENENYSWLENKEGITLNVPKPGYDHHMDGIRYAITSLKKSQGNAPVLSYSQQQRTYGRSQIDVNKFK